MADVKDIGENEKKDTSSSTAPETKTKKKKKKGIFSTIWNGIFSRQSDNFEKRLEYISKEETTVKSRMKRRSHTWSKMRRHLIIFSFIFEVVAVGYAIATTRSTDLNWKMRAFRVLPMFLLPALASLCYSAFGSYVRMCDRKDKKTLERLGAEKKAKIDELKEKTNYYITQQLIQRYDPDPAAKAAAASVLASKLGADSGLRVFVGEEPNPHALTAGKSNDVEVVPSGRLRNRKQLQPGPGSSGNTPMHQSVQDGMPLSMGIDGTQAYEQEQLVVNHHFPQGPSANDGGWVARIAALLVGEDPTQSYALICGNCHMHNGLARKEDFPFVTYYCPHCQALNRPKQSEEHVSGLSSPNSGSVRGVGSSDVVKNARAPATSEAIVTSDNHPVEDAPAQESLEEVPETAAVSS